MRLLIKPLVKFLECVAYAEDHDLVASLKLCESLYKHTLAVTNHTSDVYSVRHSKIHNCFLCHA